MCERSQKRHAGKQRVPRPAEHDLTPEVGAGGLGQSRSPHVEHGADGLAGAREAVEPLSKTSSEAETHRGRSARGCRPELPPGTRTPAPGCRPVELVDARHRARPAEEELTLSRRAPPARWIPRPDGRSSGEGSALARPPPLEAPRESAVAGRRRRRRDALGEIFDEQVAQQAEAALGGAAVRISPEPRPVLAEPRS